MNALDILLSNNSLPKLSSIDLIKEKFVQNLKKGNITNLEQLKIPFEISEEQKSEFKSWFDKLNNWEFLYDYFNNPNVEEIVLKSNFHGIIIDHKNKNTFILKDINSIELLVAIDLLLQSTQNNLNNSNPFVSFKTFVNNIPFRVSITHPSICAEGFYKINFRRISKKIFPLTEYSTNTEYIDLSLSLFHAKKNIIIAGSTGSGKTSFLSSLIKNINENTHTLILEDTDEIIAPNKSSTKFLATKELGKTLNDFCSYALRLSPERLILGEIRSAEVVPYTLLMNCGHRGLISTIHSDGATDVVERMSLLFSLYSDNPNISEEHIKKLICKNIDIVIYLENKKIKEIIQLIGYSNNQIISENLLEESLF